MPRNPNLKIAELLNLQPRQVEQTISLLDNGNTIPFIARYRKEVTFNLDEFQIRQINTHIEKIRQVDDRRETILKSIAEQEKLTPKLEKILDEAESLQELEDIYIPYKPKRTTRASVAREKGLEPLAQHILAQSSHAPAPHTEAKKYLSDEVKTVDDALSGARDIIAETIHERADIRQKLRERVQQWGKLITKPHEIENDKKRTHESYYNFEMTISRIRPHQTLAINRAESEKIIKVKVQVEERDWRDTIMDHVDWNRRSNAYDELVLAIEDAAKRLIVPAIERDIRRMMTEYASTHAIDVFADNLKNLLLQPPLNGHVILGVDPAYRTGCKVAVIDATGKVLHTDTVYPNPPQKQVERASHTVHHLIKKYRVTLIAIGNGTASRETEHFIADIAREFDHVQYLIVNEAGASVYSASDLARAELPDLDVSIRGAVSIARRVQDPLAELVKIDAKSIGVGLYQHDVNQTNLSQALDEVVESTVNQVGVDVNTASPALLQHIAGIGQKLANNIISYRDENGQFQTRAQIKKVKGMGAKAFEQSAGFLRIMGGRNWLDYSAIHPESYTVAKAIIEEAGITPKMSIQERKQRIQQYRHGLDMNALAQSLNTGIPTLTDIFDQLAQPGRDPRSELPKPLLRSDVMTMDDLVSGQVLQGTVRNIVDFGAFVDIGVKQDGLLHISQIPRHTSLSVGDIIKVGIKNVDKDRGRIGLTMAE